LIDSAEFQEYLEKVKKLYYKEKAASENDDDDEDEDDDDDEDEPSILSVAFHLYRSSNPVA
jgi:hypothetical protein